MLSTLEGGESPNLRRTNRNLLFVRGSQLIEETNLGSTTFIPLPRLIYKSGQHLDSAILKLDMSFSDPALTLEKEGESLAELNIFGPMDIDEIAIFNPEIHIFQGRGSGFGTALAELGDILMISHLERSGIKRDFTRIFAVVSCGPGFTPENSWEMRVMRDLQFKQDLQLAEQVSERLSYPSPLLFKEY